MRQVFYKYGIIGCLLLLFSLSCKDDKYKYMYVSEAHVSFAIQQKPKGGYHKIYGLGAKNTVLDTTFNLSLPLDLNKDTTIYVFEATDLPNDTLTLVYSRVLNPYQDIEAGCQSRFSMTIDNLTVSDELTTFKEDEISVSLEPQQ